MIIPDGGLACMHSLERSLPIIFNISIYQILINLVFDSSQIILHLEKADLLIFLLKVKISSSINKLWICSKTEDRDNIILGQCYIKEYIQGIAY